MKLKDLSLTPFQYSLTTGQIRSSLILKIMNEQGKSAYGEVAPLPLWSLETIDQVLDQFHRNQKKMLMVEWEFSCCLQEIGKLNFSPSLRFGLESALLSLLSPLEAISAPTSALLMGSPKEILAQAALRKKEGYKNAKLKVSQLTFEEAATLIHELKKQFLLRIDVNSAWETSDSLNFFSQFPLTTFDYVEEPFQNPLDLKKFPHPLAVDESFPKKLSLDNLESLPTLKALIYKPTLQGGLLNALPLQEWTIKKNIQFVLSSSFESDLGLAHIAAMAKRLSLSVPIGIGTYHYLDRTRLESNWNFSSSFAKIPKNFAIP